LVANAGVVRVAAFIAAVAPTTQARRALLAYAARARVRHCSGLRGGSAGLAPVGALVRR